VIYHGIVSPLSSKYGVIHYAVDYLHALQLKEVPYIDGQGVRSAGKCGVDGAGCSSGK
jgi:hypothetical protein